MGLDIGDDITYVLAAYNNCEDRPVLWVWIDRVLDLKNCFTEIDQATLCASQGSSAPLRQSADQSLPNFVSYRFTALDFWRKTFDVRKNIWEA